MNIRQHKLAWRWTDRRYAVFPDDILDQLQLVDEIESRQLHEQALSCLGKYALSSKFDSNTTITEHLSGEQGSNWLVQQHPLSETEVVLSWDPTVALKTSWSVFVEYWQQFCYPASDDLVVFPLGGAWVLLYHHEEAFHFGRRKTDA